MRAVVSEPTMKERLLRRFLLEALGCYVDKHGGDDAVYGYIQNPDDETTELVVMAHGGYYRLTIEHLIS